MTVTQDLLTSDVPDIGDVPLSVLLTVDAGEYIRILRRIGIRDAETVTPVSAFNSSI